MDSEPSVNGFGISCGLPAVRAPVNGCGREHFDSQISSRRDCPNFRVKPPCGEFGASLLYLISSDRLWRHVEDFRFEHGSCALEIFRLRQEQRHSGTSSAADQKSWLGSVFRVPNLLWNGSTMAGL